MSEGYRYERTTWTDGTGETHDVVKFYVPDDDDDWMTCDLLPDGACLRLWSRGPVYMRSASPSYPSIEAAVAEVKSAHMDWLATDRDGWRQAIGVLAQEGAGATGRTSDDRCPDRPDILDAG